MENLTHERIAEGLYQWEIDQWIEREGYGPLPKRLTHQRIDQIIQGALKKLALALWREYELDASTIGPLGRDDQTEYR